MEHSVIERLQAKSPEEAIIEQISRDFNPAPFMAKTQFEQMKYFEQYFELARGVGQMTFLALSVDNPPGRLIAECKRVAVTLTVDSADDLEALRHGIAELCTEGKSKNRPSRCWSGQSFRKQSCAYLLGGLTSYKRSLSTSFTVLGSTHS